MALETSPESPAPVRQIVSGITSWVDRLGAVWVEGQVTQVNRRSGMSTVFMVLRDKLADVSMTATCNRAVIDALPTPLVEGARIVVHAKPQVFPNRGSLSLQVREIRLVGEGELLARLERRRRLLAAEGLFAEERKRPLPFLPGRIGLVTAQSSAAERDVLENTRRRWPGVRFTVKHVPMQGPQCATAVMEALDTLDRDRDVDVIVIARGGGSVEDLLPFSDEALVRAVFHATTPVVSAIGHEPDSPILDLVADARASTPTDAARHLVPDVAHEAQLVWQLQERGRQAMRARISHEMRQLQDLRSRPALADPRQDLAHRLAEVDQLRQRARRVFGHVVDRAEIDLGHQLARVRSLSPLTTLRRGYAIISDEHGGHVASVADAPEGASLNIRVADGRIAATVTGTTEMDLPPLPGDPDDLDEAEEVEP